MSRYGDKIQCCIYLPKRIKRLLEDSGQNHSDLVARLLAMYFQRHNSLEEVERKIKEHEDEIGVLKIHREDLIEKKDKHKKDDTLQYESRTALREMWEMGKRWNISDSFNIEWLESPANMERVAFSGFDDTVACLKWLKGEKGE